MHGPAPRLAVEDVAYDAGGAVHLGLGLQRSDDDALPLLQFGYLLPLLQFGCLLPLLHIGGWGRRGRRDGRCRCNVYSSSRLQLRVGASCIVTGGRRRAATGACSGCNRFA